MTLVTSLLPANYGWVLLVASSSSIISLWHGMRVTSARKAAGCPYPNAYATDEEAKKNVAAYKFNCAQRAHTNFLENYTEFLVTLAIAGLEYPLVSAGLGAAWLVGRVMYAVGYVGSNHNERGKGRYIGAPLIYPSKLGLLGMSFYTSYKLIA